MAADECKLPNHTPHRQPFFHLFIYGLLCWTFRQSFFLLFRLSSTQMKMFWCLQSQHSSSARQRKQISILYFFPINTKIFFLHYLILDRVESSLNRREVFSLLLSTGRHNKKKNGLFVHLTNPQKSNLILIMNFHHHISALFEFLHLWDYNSYHQTSHHRLNHFFIFFNRLKGGPVVEKACEGLHLQSHFSISRHCLKNFIHSSKLMS